MSIGEPPIWTTYFDEVELPEPVRVAIGRAAERIGEVDVNRPDGQATAFEPFDVSAPVDPLDVIRPVEFAFRLQGEEDRQWSPVFRSYFVESVAALALTRARSGLPPLASEDVVTLLRDGLKVFEPFCAPA
ncbi:hypothetical protein GCM10027406_14070 [Leifsonia lichenia]